MNEYEKINKALDKLLYIELDIIRLKLKIENLKIRKVRIKLDKRIIEIQKIKRLEIAEKIIKRHENKIKIKIKETELQEEKDKFFLNPDDFIGVSGE